MIINIKGEKNKKRFILPLCIIIILIIVLVLLNTFKNKKVEKINYYYVALAKLEDKLVNTLDNNQYNNNFNQYKNYNTNNIYDYKIKNKIKFFIIIIIIMLILFLLWHIPFIRNLINHNILLQTIFSFFS